VAEAVPWIGLAVRVVAAAIWLVSGAAKVVDLSHFEAQVQAYELLPGALEAPFTYALPFVEVAIGLYLIVGLLVRPVAIFACLLMVVFIAALGQAWGTRSLARLRLLRRARPRARRPRDRPARRRARDPEPHPRHLAGATLVARRLLARSPG
jgi:uncharacterized membrane protein YphA (DoxX/SURF4 family)